MGKIMNYAKYNGKEDVEENKDAGYIWWFAFSDCCGLISNYKSQTP